MYLEQVRCANDVGSQLQWGRFWSQPVVIYSLFE